MIEVKNLVKKYGDHIAVDHLSFTVEEGHIYESGGGQEMYWLSAGDPAFVYRYDTP